MSPGGGHATRTIEDFGDQVLLAGPLFVCRFAQLRRRCPAAPPPKAAAVTVDARLQGEAARGHLRHTQAAERCGPPRGFVGTGGFDPADRAEETVSGRGRVVPVVRRSGSGSCPAGAAAGRCTWPAGRLPPRPPAPGPAPARAPVADGPWPQSRSRARPALPPTQGNNSSRTAPRTARTAREQPRTARTARTTRYGDSHRLDHGPQRPRCRPARRERVFRWSRPRGSRHAGGRLDS